MQLTDLALAHFRNYERAQLSFHPGINVFLGANGMGKTNLLESLYFLALGHGFRAVREEELLRWGDHWLQVKGRYLRRDSDRPFIQDIRIGVGKRRLYLNEVAYDRLEAMPSRLLVVLFTPDDLAIIKGGPEKRRRFLDRELEGLRPELRADRLAYRRALAQRNELLREIRAGRAAVEDLAPWNLALAEAGARVTLGRLGFLRLVVPRARRVHAYMAREAGAFEITYQSSLGHDVARLSEAELKARLLERLETGLAADLRHRATGWGPHRDDLVFYENKTDLRTYGSQGQQRTAILAMKLAEIEAFERLYGRMPILLLDDVTSELDETRQWLLLRAIEKKGIQTFLTTTHLDDKIKNAVSGAFFSIEEGKIIQRS